MQRHSRRFPALPLRSAIILPVAALTGLLVAAPAAHGVGIQGTMSNFDVFNETGQNVYGAEIDLDGVTPAEVLKTFPCHFTGFSETPYATGTGTKIIFTGYNFSTTGYMISTTGINTNGHYCVNLPGCEHFGFSVTVQPTATKFYWLGQTGQQITTPLAIPGPTWTYKPAAGGNAPVIQAVLPAPPAPAPFQYPDAVWVKTYVTELTSQADLNQLISYDPNNIDPAQPSISPQLPSEVESEWELIAGDMVGSNALAEPDINLGADVQAVVRRYEIYRYTGGYDEVHLPTSSFTGGSPAAGELGQFISANMAAVNLESLIVPEPASIGVLGGGVLMLLARRRVRPGRT